MNPSGIKKIYSKSSYDKIQKWIHYLGYEFMSFTNVSHDVHWNKKISSIDIDSLVHQLDSHDKFIALGCLVSDVLSRLNYDHFKLPHPSPLNRQMNDMNFVYQQLDLCKEYLNEDTNHRL